MEGLSEIDLELLHQELDGSEVFALAGLEEDFLEFAPVVHQQLVYGGLF